MDDYTHYNDRVNSATVERLLELNRQFYTLQGRDFAETRLRIQPGVLRIIKTLHGDEAILDLGCGSGTFARELARVGHRGQYLGLDSSIPLLESARGSRYAFPVGFLRADLAESSRGLPAVAERPTPDRQTSEIGGTRFASPAREGWSMITAFAVLHHIPGNDLRVRLLHCVRDMLNPDGRFVLSNWQFTSSSRLRKRIQPWASLNTRLELDPGDYLLDWRRGESAVRYVHEFDEGELGRLADETGFVVTETFYSDGENHRSGLYQQWRPA